MEVMLLTSRERGWGVGGGGVERDFPPLSLALSTLTR